MLTSTVMLNAIALAHRDPASRDGVCVEKKHMQSALIRHQRFKRFIDNVKGESEKRRGFGKVEETDDE